MVLFPPSALRKGSVSPLRYPACAAWSRDDTQRQALGLAAAQ